VCTQGSEAADSESLQAGAAFVSCDCDGVVSMNHVVNCLQRYAGK